jgi:tripartite-type tricarboxylate transporter receptor subunit TctC
MNAAKIGGFTWKETAYNELTPLLVIQGDADVITFSTPGLKDYIESGQMKLLACMLPDRLPDYPGVPTVTEQGFGDAYSICLVRLFRKTPDEIVQKLSDAFFKVMAMPEIQAVIAKAGVISHPTVRKRREHRWIWNWRISVKS